MGAEPGWHGDRLRARRIADALHKLTGRQPAVAWIRDGGTRVTVRVAEPPDAARTLAVLRLLDLGDRFGHSDSARWERLWVEVSGVPDPAAAVRDRPAR
ncbi:hypothetical protein AB0K51_12200 [Kitasatospora sp. NPDC049285]|uniref:hypothetical protein n=1 Tax=Kitasatospora sp. NPDC049285 TaxID=3157096 RepID=UPI00343F7F0C